MLDAVRRGVAAVKLDASMTRLRHGTQWLKGQEKLLASRVGVVAVVLSVGGDGVVFLQKLHHQMITLIDSLTHSLTHLASFLRRFWRSLSSTGSEPFTHVYTISIGRGGHSLGGRGWVEKGEVE
jgi:hypothetical protein